VNFEEVAKRRAKLSSSSGLFAFIRTQMKCIRFSRVRVQYAEPFPSAPFCGRGDHTGEPGRKPPVDVSNLKEDQIPQIEQAENTVPGSLCAFVR
jgi:hypothetical protein